MLLEPSESLGLGLLDPEGAPSGLTAGHLEWARADSETRAPASFLPAQPADGELQASLEAFW